MQEAIGLTIALPVWFFVGGVLTLTTGSVDALVIGLPVLLSSIFLVAGVGIGIKNRYWPLLLFLISLVFAHVLVFFAGLYRGEVGDSSIFWIFWIFLAIQIGLNCFLVIRYRAMGRAVFFIAIFCLLYAFNAAFVSSMAFGDRWI